jgi:hypothetical protein
MVSLKNSKGVFFFFLIYSFCFFFSSSFFFFQITKKNKTTCIINRSLLFFLPLILGRHRLWHWTTTVSDHLRSPSFRSWLMDTSLVNAFADVCLEQILEFHLWLFNTNTPNRSSLSLFKKTTSTLVLSNLLLLSHAFLFNHFYNLSYKNYLKHSNLFKVNFYISFHQYILSLKKKKQILLSYSFSSFLLLPTTSVLTATTFV